jgi:outer membrane lipoprotein LolB
MIRRISLFLALCTVLSACVTTRPVPTTVTAPWDQRVKNLQHLAAWQLDGRAAVAVGKQGWQASLNWHQDAAATEVHLAGPLGVGALTLKQTADGVSLNGAPPSEAVVAQLQDRLGFELPLDNLRYWLLGVPDPDTTFELARNPQDRAQQLTQDGWTVVYDRYMGVNGDLLPAHLVLSRDDVRVRIAVDRWDGLR